MRKLLLLAVALFGFSFANSQTPSCDELFDYVKGKSGYPTTQYVYGSTAISKIEWYNFESKYYAAVYFTSNYSKGYLYGGWGWSDYYDIKDAFDNPDSYGKAFWEYIESTRVNCY